MRKSLVKLFVFFCTFLLALVIFSKLMNKGHDNLTMEMAPATLPIVTMVMDGMEYNQLHGVTAATDIAFQRDTVTILGKNRNTGSFSRSRRIPPCTSVPRTVSCSLT